MTSEQNQQQKLMSVLPSMSKLSTSSLSSSIIKPKSSSSSSLNENQHVDQTYSTTNHHLSTYDFLLGILYFHLLSFIIISCNIILLYGTLYYPKSFGIYITIPYFSYTLYTRYELKDGYHIIYFSKYFFIFTKLRQYLKMTVIHSSSTTSTSTTTSNNDEASSTRSGTTSTSTTTVESSSSNYMFAVFPHGTNCDYRMLMDGMMDQIVHPIMMNQSSSTHQQQQPQHHEVKTLAASILFRIPIVRELSLYTGCIDASKHVVEYQLQKKRSILILPGGEAEQIRTTYQKEIIYLKVRKGFIKLALKYNTPIIPIYVFGVNDYYRTLTIFMKLRLWLVKNCGICIPICWGISSMCPLPIPTTIFVGQSICYNNQTTINDNNDNILKSNSSNTNNKDKHNYFNPTQEMIDQVHEQFCQEIIRLFDHNKHKYGYGDRTLEIV